MSEEDWPEEVIRSRGTYEFIWPGLGVLGKIIRDGPRPVICADCGTPIEYGKVIHLKPETYAISYQGETFYLERHLCLECAKEWELML